MGASLGLGGMRRLVGCGVVPGPVEGDEEHGATELVFSLESSLSSVFKTNTNNPNLVGKVN